ncbi:expressed unknown protein [Seminavis robusta]|uniref:Uncharacterized protein n=1 Tax=Seminavis robusta TaxID=568900 RepID=A0A9N8DEX0_9STRA|nr:expressed unknown protein [Seminavis robusta]|eukprot:Sro56_g033070.1 n/a (338) ;mRNA; r:147375-148388
MAMVVEESMVAKRWQRANSLESSTDKVPIFSSLSICTCSSRRSMMATALALPVLVAIPTVGSCEEALPFQDKEEDDGDNKRGGKPFAPASALLPATQLKLAVDQLYDLSQSLDDKTASTQQQQKYQTLQQMSQLWKNRPPLFTTTTSAKQQQRLPPRASPSTAQLTTGISSANKQQYQANRKDLTSLPDRMAAMLNQADVERQWGMLQYQESKLESNNELRAALNYYTSQLEFGQAYLLTASKETRKQLIRNDQLPSLTAVITADLDLRDLYRNDFLTAMDDAIAEMEYQLKLTPQEVDVTDVVELLEQAHTALSKWFGLIAWSDVQEAVETMRQEG